MRSLYLFLALVVVAGCGRQNIAITPSPPVSQPARAGLLKPVEVTYGIYLARLEHHIDVSPSGYLRSVHIAGKSYGPKDMDPSHALISIREGQLTPDQQEKLAFLLEKLQTFSTDCGSAPDGRELEIVYGSQCAKGGLMPKEGGEIYQYLDTVSQAMTVSAGPGR